MPRGTCMATPAAAPRMSADAARAAQPNAPREPSIIGPSSQSSPNGFGRLGLGGRRNTSSSFGPVGSGRGHASLSSGGRVLLSRSPHPMSAPDPVSSRR